MKRLSDEYSYLQMRFQKLEQEKLDVTHETYQHVSEISNLKRIIKDCEADKIRLDQFRIDAEKNAELLREASKEALKEKKELKRKLDELSRKDNSERTRSNKNYDELKNSSNKLIDFILNLEFAYDEEFDNLFKNQSYANDFDKAEKHLETQKEIVDHITSELQKDYDSIINQNEDFKEYISTLEKQIETLEGAKSQSDHWKQSYERLTAVLKNTEDGKEKNIEDILADYSNIQDRLNDMQKDLSQKDSSLKDSLNTRLNLEKEKEKLYNEIENQKKVSSDLSEKYEECQNKLSDLDTLEARIKTLEKENHSLQDQNTVLKKTNSEQLKSLSIAPVEMMTTINSMKSSVKKKEIEIKELRAQNIRLEQLVDEARDAIRQNEEDISREIERSTFEDALNILDDIISQPSISTSKARNKEFSNILKKVQYIRDQAEEPFVYKVLAIIKHHIDTDFSEQEEQCKTLNDYKSLLARMFGWYRDSQKTSLITHDDSEILNISTDSKSIRKPYKYKES